MSFLAALLVRLFLSAQVPAALPPAPDGLTDTTIVTLVQLVPAFHQPSSRTNVTVLRKMVIPNTDNVGWFAEITWAEGARRRTALLAIARTDRPDRAPETWIVRREPWGIASLQEDKTWDDLIEDLLAAKNGSMESRAVGRLRAMISAQLTFAALAGGGFTADVKCLTTPAVCGVKGAEVGFIDDSFLRPAVGEYHYTLYVGAPMKPDGRRFETFAFTAVPTAAGLAAYCADDTGRLCRRGDGKPPRVEKGACMDPCEAVK